jgi:hypothetical protein
MLRHQLHGTLHINGCLGFGVALSFSFDRKREYKMSVKKLLILTAAGVASVGATAAMAGGPDVMMPPAPQAAENHFYAEANFGYAMQQYSANTSGTGIGSANTPAPINPIGDYSGDGVNGGGVYGADFGYMANEHLGAELGWTFLPRFSHSTPSSGVVGAIAKGPISTHSVWGAWAVVKAVAPLAGGFSAFAKAGVGFRYMTIQWSNDSFQTGRNDACVEEWRPILAVGASYDVNEDMSVSLQWMRFIGGSSYSIGIGSGDIGSYVVAPSSDVVSLSFGYKFGL